MSIKPNTLRVFYKSIEQRIKVFDKTDESQVLKLIKRVFHISADISKVFLQDGDGDLICFPEQIPNGLCVHVYVEPDLVPTPPPVPFTLINSNLLPGFKWCKKTTLMPLSIMNDGYTVGDGKHFSISAVASTTEYQKGVLFSKLVIEVAPYQVIGIVSSPYSGQFLIKYNNDFEDDDPFIMTEEFFNFNNNYQLEVLGILLDTNKKCVEFMWLKNDDQIVKREIKKIKKLPVKIYACTKGNQITIKEGGSSPIPKHDSSK